MSTIKVNEILDASGGNTAQINGATPTAYNTMGRNRIINGAMEIDQRNAGAAVTYNSGSAWVYSLDRWNGIAETARGVYTIQQSSVAPSGFVNSMKATVTTADSSLSTGLLYNIRQCVEGFNVADLNWGTANAKTVTLSFWVYSSLTGTFGGSLQNSAQNRSYPFTYTISAANTWEQKSITIAGDTTGTWLTTNGIGLIVNLNLGAGTSLLGTAGAWAGSSFYGATGQTQVISTNGATFYITGVQLEVGSVATEFERRPYGTELALCQRYFQVIAADNGNSIPAGWWFDQTTSIVADVSFLQTMRAKPTLVVTANSFRVNSPSLNQTATASLALSADETSVFSGRIGASGFSGGTTGQPANFRIFGATANTYVAFSSEL